MFAIIEKAVVLTAAFVLYGTINTWKKNTRRKKRTTVIRKTSLLSFQFLTGEAICFAGFLFFFLKIDISK